MQVVRCFEDDNVVHVAGKVDPKEDTFIINTELLIADIVQIEKRQERLKKGVKANATSEQKAAVEAEKRALQKILDGFDEGLAARAVQLTEEEKVAVAGLQLLTMKPMTYAANVAENELEDPDKNVHVQV